MDNNIEVLKEKIMKKLPEVLPKVVKSVIVHIVMIIYHISMPPWVTAIKIKKMLKTNTHTKEGINQKGYRHRRRGHL